MKTGYFDCIAGASGDMILGALLDAGADETVLRAELEKLGLDEFKLGVREVSKNGFAAKKVDVHVHDHAHARALPEIEAIVERSGIAPDIKRRAMEVFRIVGAAEAKIHNIPLEQVHLHELGGVDTIVDVVGTLVAVESLGLERMVASPLPMGRGFIVGAHGQIPLPAPATAAILKGVPVVGTEIGAELVTPTGAALLLYLCGSFGEMPAMTYDALGYGAGGRDLEIPNVLRLFVGTVRPARGDGDRVPHLARNEYRRPQSRGVRACDGEAFRGGCAGCLSHSRADEEGPARHAAGCALQPGRAVGGAGCPFPGDDDSRGPRTCGDAAVAPASDFESDDGAW